MHWYNILSIKYIFIYLFALIWYPLHMDSRQTLSHKLHLYDFNFYTRLKSLYMVTSYHSLERHSNTRPLDFDALVHKVPIKQHRKIVRICITFDIRNFHLFSNLFNTINIMFKLIIKGRYFYQFDSWIRWAIAYFRPITASHLYHVTYTANQILSFQHPNMADPQGLLTWRRKRQTEYTYYCH